MAEAVLERELNTQEQRTAKMREALYEERAREAFAADSFRAPAQTMRTSSPVPAQVHREEVQNASPVNPTLERINSYVATPAAPARNHELFKDVEFTGGELMRKSADGEIMVPVFETVKNIVEAQYIDIPNFEKLQASVTALEEAIEEDDALPTRRTMETVIRPAAAVQEMTTEAPMGFREAVASLSMKTKAVLLSVISAIVLAIVLICVNTGIIRSLDGDLGDLRARAAEQQSTYEYLQEQSDLYTDPDSDIVREWAENNGMTR